MSLGLLSYLVRPIVLNTPPAPPTSCPSATAQTAADAAADLRMRIQELYVAHVTSSGVDYAALASGPAFSAYKASAAAIPPPPSSNAARTAFFVNLYNALTIHAYASLGPPAENALARLFFNARAAYNVAGLTYSLSDLENGVLRRNQGVAICPPPFRDGDPRLAHCVDRLDPRIHFVLNCGAMSCPPIRFLAADSLDADLELAARAFLSRRDNFAVTLLADTDFSESEDERGDEEDGGELGGVEAGVGAVRLVEVVLSAIFRWYRVDFADGDGEVGVLRYVAAHAAEGCPHAEVLRRALRGGVEAMAGIRVSYAPYDWSLNAMKGVE